MVSTEPSTCSATICTQVKGRKDTGTVTGCHSELTERLKSNKLGCSDLGCDSLPLELVDVPLVAAECYILYYVCIFLYVYIPNQPGRSHQPDV